MIGSLLYLTTSHLNIMFATILCARYQANPKESHLYAIKRIFHYLKHALNDGYGIHMIQNSSWSFIMTLIMVDVVSIERVLQQELN